MEQLLGSRLPHHLNRQCRTVSPNMFTVTCCMAKNLTLRAEPITPNLQSIQEIRRMPVLPNERHFSRKAEFFGGPSD